MKKFILNIWCKGKFCNVYIFIVFQTKCVIARICDYITENEAVIKGNVFPRNIYMEGVEF